MVTVDNLWDLSSLFWRAQDFEQSSQVYIFRNSGKIMEMVLQNNKVLNKYNNVKVHIKII